MDGCHNYDHPSSTFFHLINTGARAGITLIQKSCASFDGLITFICQRSQNFTFVTPSSICFMKSVYLNSFFDIISTSCGVSKCIFFGKCYVIPRQTGNFETQPHKRPKVTLELTSKSNFNYARMTIYETRNQIECL